MTKNAVPCPLGPACSTSSKTHDPSTRVFREHAAAAKRTPATTTVPATATNIAANSVSNDIYEWALRDISGTYDGMGEAYLNDSGNVPEAVATGLRGLLAVEHENNVPKREVEEWLDDLAPNGDGTYLAWSDEFSDDVARYITEMSKPVEKAKFDAELSEMQASIKRQRETGESSKQWCDWAEDALAEAEERVRETMGQATTYPGIELHTALEGLRKEYRTGETDFETGSDEEERYRRAMSSITSSLRLRIRD